MVHPNQSIQLDHVEINGKDFLIEYLIMPEQTKYVFRVTRDTNEIQEIARKETLRPLQSGSITQLEERAREVALRLSAIAPAIDTLDTQVKYALERAAAIGPEFEAFFARISCYDTIAKKRSTEEAGMGWSDRYLSKAQWAQIQKKLVTLKLLPNGRKSIDGKDGPQTRGAIRLLHKQRNINPAVDFLSKEEADELLNIDSAVTEAMSKLPTSSNCDQFNASSRKTSP
jgi:hypothetical protein